MSTNPTTNIIGDAVRDAVIGTLLGGLTIEHQTIDPSSGALNTNSVTLDGVLRSRLQAKAHNGDFDELLDQAIATIDPELLGIELTAGITRALIAAITDHGNRSWHRPESWLTRKIPDLANTVLTAALTNDDELLDKLRHRIGIAADRDDLSVAVSLAPREG